MLDNLKIMNKYIKCKRCGTQIKLKTSYCPECGLKNDKPKHLLIALIVAVIVVVIIIANIISIISLSIKKDKERKASYSWPTTGIATLLPEPNLKYGKIVNDDADYFTIYLYDPENADFNSYVDKCKEKGFTVDYKSSTYDYKSKDASGNYLEVFFFDSNDSEMHISIKSAQKIAEEDAQSEKMKAESDAKKQADAAAKAAKEQKAEENKQKADEATNKITDTVNKLKESTKSSKTTDFRKWVDDYEKFMNEYVDFMSNYDPSDYKQLAKYTKLVADYTKWLNDEKNLDKNEYSDEDWQYLLDAETRVNQRLSTIQ